MGKTNEIEKKITKGELKVLAFDLALNTSGWALIKYGNGEVEIEDYGMFTGFLTPSENKEYNTGNKLLKIESKLEEIFSKHEVDVIVKEGTFWARDKSHEKANIQLAKVQGLFELIATKKGYEIAKDVPATKVKKQLVGKGDASKKEVEIEVERITNQKFDNHNVTDAIGVGITYLMLNKLILVQ